MLDTANLRRVGRIHDLQPREAGPASKALGQHLGAEAGTTHSEQQHVAKVAALDVSRECVEMADRGPIVDATVRDTAAALVAAGALRDVNDVVFE